MAHSLTPVPAISTGSSSSVPLPSSGQVRILNRASAPATLDYKPVGRRAATLGLAGALLGLSVGGDRSANAAGRRAPPPPPKEKQDPNVSGVLAKVLASKKRKEAMKEAAAKLRERGKPVEVKQAPE